FGAYRLGGWTSIVILAAIAIALTFALLARFLIDELSPVASLTLVMASLLLAAPHIVARPHVLALPVMVAWFAGLVRAADRHAAPSLLLLPLMVLWANLHGGFTLGLALIVPIALEAVWTTHPQDRRRTIVRWGVFGILAVIVASITPYGPESML